MKRVTRRIAWVLFWFLLVLSFVHANGWMKMIQGSFQLIPFYFDGNKETNQSGTYFNGKAEAPLSLIDQGTTDVLLRYIKEKLGKEVVGDGNTHTIRIGKQPAVLDEKPTGTPENLYGLSLGQPQSKVVERLGKPQRIDRGALGFDWWIYNRDYRRYVQVGIKNGKVVEIYSNAPTWTFAGLKVGSSLEELKRAFPLQAEVTFSYDGAQFRVKNDVAKRPIVMVNGEPVIFYLDLHDSNKITAIRLLTREHLVKSRMYNLTYTYSGRLPDMSQPQWSEAEQREVDAGNERQIFDLANVIRLRHQLPLLEWNEAAAEVARAHSRDMRENRYFDHVSATTGLDPFERLERGGIRFQAAGENIAYGYRDAIEAHEGWMNSPGHRKNLLNPVFKTLGVGVVGEYYTQNFVTP